MRIAGYDLPAASARAAKTRKLAKGATLFRQGDPAVAVYAVERGRIRLIRHLANGKAVAIHVASAKDSFAEAALFSDVYHCDAVASEPTIVWVLPKAAVLGLLRAENAAALAFAAGLARQIQKLRARIETQALRSARERILHHLALHDEKGERTLKELAAELDLTHESLYRTLAALEREGAIQRKGRRVRRL